MLVTVSGAQGCGKSTILEGIERLGYPVIQRKTSRSILSDWGKTLDEINDDPTLSKMFQEEILARKFNDESEAVRSGDIVFTERTYMDLFVYTLVNLGKFNEHSDWLNEYYLKCLNAQESYAKVFYVQSGMFQVAHDGVRGSNVNYSKMIDLVLQHYTMNSVDESKVHLIATSNQKERIQFITTNIASLV